MVTFPFACILQPKSVIVGLIKEMIAKFQEELPLYSVPSSNEAQQVDLLAYIAKITEGLYCQSDHLKSEEVRISPKKKKLEFLTNILYSLLSKFSK